MGGGGGGSGNNNNIKIPKNATVADVVGGNPSYDGIPIRAIQDEVDPKFVEEYANDMRKGAFDWSNMDDQIELIRDNKGYVLGQGHHRFIAAQLAGVDIPRWAIVFEDVRPTTWSKTFEWTQVRWTGLK